MSLGVSGRAVPADWECRRKECMEDTRKQRRRREEDIGDIAILIM